MMDMEVEEFASNAIQHIICNIFVLVAESNIF